MSLESIGKRVGEAKGDLSYKYQRLRERLRLAVTNGELTGKLPGERELARRYAANAKTINKALNDLAMEGLVLRHVGRGTFVAGSGPNRRIPAMPSRTFAWIAPGVDAKDGQMLVSITSELLQARGHRLETMPAQLDEFGELPEGVLNPRTLRQIDGVLIYAARPSRELLANLRRRHLPVVMINNCHTDIRLPTVLADQSHGAFAVTERCIQSGHSRIQLLIRPESLPAGLAAWSGHAAAMQYYGLEPLARMEVGAGFDWSGLVTTGCRPSALVCSSGQLALEARQKMVEAGLTVPTHMSVAAICGPGETCVEREAITSYEFDPKRVMHWATEFITEGTTPHGPQMAILPGRLVDRGSVAPPESRPEHAARPVAEACRLS